MEADVLCTLGEDSGTKMILLYTMARYKDGKINGN